MKLTISESDVEWINLGEAAQLLATLAPCINHPDWRELAMEDAQKLMDQLWLMGFRPRYLS